MSPRAVGELEGQALARAVRRNTILLSAAMAVTSATLQLVAAVATITLDLVIGIEGLLGLGPAIFLVSAALTTLPAGRAMDRLGRVPVLAVGCLTGIAGCLVTALGARAVSAPAVVLGFVLIGAASGTILLSRAAAGDMFPPERRARGIAWVLFGAVFGAILGPAVFSPLFAGKELEPGSLVVPWLVGAGFMATGLVLFLNVRPDPKAIAERIATSPPTSDDRAAPLTEIVRRPGVVPALLGALASFGVMAGVMNLTGYAVVHEHGHEQADVFPIVGAHVLGMYALVLVVGTVVDRLGGTGVLVGGLALMGASSAALPLAESVPATAIALFGLGLGWNLSFVAATTALVNRTAPYERGKLLGFNDLASSLLGASLALLGGVALQGLGLVVLAAGMTVLVLAPAAFIVRSFGWRAAPVAASGEGR
ncbi:MAG: MFS transporter [Actinomycetota bacterium]|nr:MFS transporter [Actinomycetota bacterium]